MISNRMFSCIVCWDSHPYCESKHKMCGITGNWYFTSRAPMQQEAHFFRCGRNAA